MPKEKARRNKTIDISVEDGRQFLERCITVNKTVELTDIIDKTILGGCMEVMPLLPMGFVDLLIADPPYNLDKDFDGRKFKKTTDDLYIEYTESWIEKVIPLLKPNATIYVCCDWRSSSAIETVLKGTLIFKTGLLGNGKKDVGP